mmetsp:Transcript_13410/g.34386  ORF Transcript_13410/g.34386 Transcript_13410/m.34386 type:complete len:87 (-) Transcript_13410:289-549(-)
MFDGPEFESGAESDGDGAVLSVPGGCHTYLTSMVAAVATMTAIVSEFWAALSAGEGEGGRPAYPPPRVFSPCPDSAAAHGATGCGG